MYMINIINWWSGHWPSFVLISITAVLIYRGKDAEAVLLVAIALILLLSEGMSTLIDRMESSRAALKEVLTTSKIYNAEADLASVLLNVAAEKRRLQKVLDEREQAAVDIEKMSDEQIGKINAAVEAAKKEIKSLTDGVKCVPQKGDDKESIVDKINSSESYLCSNGTEVLRAISPIFAHVAKGDCTKGGACNPTYSDKVIIK